MVCCVHAVPRGGFLFEYYLLTASGYSDNRTFRQAIHRVTQNGDEWIGAPDEEYLINATGAKFAGWLLFHVSNIGTNGREQLFYLTFAAKYHGLSRQGIDVLSKYGFATNMTRFDDMRRICLSKSRIATQYETFYHEFFEHHPLVTTMQASSLPSAANIFPALLRSCRCPFVLGTIVCCLCAPREVMLYPHMLWWDNFSKNIARYCPTLGGGVYSSCLWTGSAVFSSPEFRHLDSSVKFDPDGAVIPAMPEDLFANRFAVLQGLTRVFQQGRSRYSYSLSYKHQVHVVPLKILDEDDQKNQLSPDEHAMNIVYPERIMDKNIGSNLGLISLLKEELHDKFGMGNPPHHAGECKNYVNINVDENIFYRVLKVRTCLWRRVWVELTLLSVL